MTEDGCTDSTAEAVTRAHPDVTILQGDGQLHWNGGMRLAWQAAMGKIFDFYLWPNDDLALAPGSLDRVLNTYTLVAASDPRVIIVGKTHSTNGTTDTYGGRVSQGGLSRLHFRPAQVGDACCDTMNGNCLPIEAISRGCAVIGPAFAVRREILDVAGATVFTIDLADSIEALRQGLTGLISTPDRRAEMTVAAVRHVKAEYAPLVFVGRYHHAISNAIRGKTL